MGYSGLEAEWASSVLLLQKLPEVCWDVLTQVSLQIKRRDYPTVFSTDVAFLGVLCSVLGLTLEEGCSQG